MTVVFEALQRTHAGVGGVFYTGLFQPTPHELHITKPLPVLSGYVPPELDGYYMRTGPNPQFDPIGGCDPVPALKWKSCAGIPACMSQPRGATARR